VEDEGQDQGGDDGQLYPEGVMVPIVGSAKLEVDEVDGGAGSRDEEELHDRVVERDVADEEVQVAGQVHQREEDLALPRDACAAHQHRVQRVVSRFPPCCVAGSGRATVLRGKRAAMTLALLLPAADFVFQILASRMKMAKTCDRSPQRRKVFIIFVSF
jgi:hypothetical protein